jgi:2-polyprenyl-3-methyl-5-hydroxy-6-metoxy-1,4-benzoquinol methylase
MPKPWWKDFFDADYLHLWGGFKPKERTDLEVEGLWQLLNLNEESRVLDAPCGYGRISRPLAERGASVLGVDQSQVLLDQAEQDREGLPEEKLRYLCHDLRQPLSENGFDAAINIFSSLGYVTEEDDLAILKTLTQAVRQGGFVLVETSHRDAMVLYLSQESKPANRLPDGTLMLEEPKLDPIRGRIETTWFWSGPKGSGEKTASMRIYTATELVSLLERAGLRFRSAHNGCSTEPFTGDGRHRLALLADRP